MLRDIHNRFVFVYLDDILTFSSTQEEPPLHVQAPPQCLQENSSYVKAEKCEFHSSTVPFLAHIVAKVNLQKVFQKQCRGWRLHLLP